VIRESYQRKNHRTPRALRKENESYHRPRGHGADAATREKGAIESFGVAGRPDIVDNSTTLPTIEEE